MAKAKYAEISSLKEKPTLLDYEQGFVKVWTELGRQVIQSELGSSGKDRRIKKKSSVPTEKSK